MTVLFSGVLKILKKKICDGTLYKGRMLKCIIAIVEIEALLPSERVGVCLCGWKNTVKKCIVAHSKLLPVE